MAQESLLQLNMHNNAERFGTQQLEMKQRRNKTIPIQMLFVSLVNDYN